MISEEQIRQHLFDLQDLQYQEFQSRLMPTVPKETVIGVRIPQLRQYAKTLTGQQDWKSYLSILPHTYYEENNLHAFLIEFLKDYEECIEALHAFLPYVNNWATCDTMSPKVLAKHLTELLGEIQIWIHADSVYTIRYGIGMLMRYYLEEAFQEEYLQWVGHIQSEEYYVNMMIAWYFATALAKQWEAVFPWISEKRLPIWIHNKAIQKAIESRRITQEQKAILKTFRE